MDPDWYKQSSSRSTSSSYETRPVIHTVVVLLINTLIPLVTLMVYWLYSGWMCKWVWHYLLFVSTSSWNTTEHMLSIFWSYVSLSIFISRKIHKTKSKAWMCLPMNISQLRPPPEHHPGSSSNPPCYQTPAVAAPCASRLDPYKLSCLSSFYETGDISWSMLSISDVPGFLPPSTASCVLLGLFFNDSLCFLKNIWLFIQIIFVVSVSETNGPLKKTLHSRSAQRSNYILFLSVFFMSCLFLTE